MKTGALCLVAVAAMAEQGSFSNVPEAASDALQFGAALPEFEAKDIAGRTWRLADLKGKYTLVHLWDTGTARAKERVAAPVGVFRMLPNLAEIQRVHEEVKPSGRVQVLTFCMDYDYTHAPEFMKGKPYDFPVFNDFLLPRKLFGRVSGTYFVSTPRGGCRTDSGHGVLRRSPWRCCGWRVIPTITAAPARKKIDVIPKAAPMPWRSASAPTVVGANPASARPML